jgi:hypothetical protein
MEGMYQNRYRELILRGTVIFLALFLFETVWYISSLSTFKAPSKWLLQISVKCPIDSAQDLLTFHDAVYAEYGLVFYAFGAYLGIAYDAKKFKGTVRGVNDTTRWNTIKRLLLAAIPVFIFYIIPVIYFRSNLGTVATLLIRYGFPSFVTGFLLFGCSKYIYEMLGIINLEDKDLQIESSMNLGKFEEQEDKRELSGKSSSRLVIDG